MSPARAKPPSATTSPDDNEEIATLRIELIGSEPLIWRQVEVPTALTLKGLHDVIQAAMGWFDYHLWEFTIGKRRFGPPVEDHGWGAEPPGNATKTRLCDVLGPATIRIGYLYDFGDAWEHRLTVSRVRAGEPGAAYPRYVGGEQVAPPEDSGGIHGFYDKLEVLADPEHPDHDAIAEWLEGYDPNTLDELPIKVAIGRLAARRRAGKSRSRKQLLP